MKYNLINLHYKLTDIADPLKRRIHFDNDPKSHLTAITDARSNTTAYQYDTAGHLIKETDPLGYITSYAYDTRGNLITKTDANGNSISYSYDALNRLLEKTYPDGSVDAFQYDARGNISYAGNRYIAYNFTYDALNRLTSVTDSNARTIQYTYDVNSNRLTLTDPKGGQTQYGYNPLNRLNTLQNGQGLTLTFNYDNLGRRTGLNYPNGLGNTYTFDAASNLSSLTLQNASSTLSSTIYSYDKVGNRLSAISTPSSENAVTQPLKQYVYYADNALADDGTVTYSYAYNGNLVSKTNKATGAVTNYSWDYENRLIQVQMSNGTIVQYAYDQFGRRIQKNVSGVVTTYLYDNQEILFEYDQNNNVQRSYTHGLRIDEPLMVNSNGSTYFYHSDALGSVTSITDSTGTMVQKNVYDAFGNTQSSNAVSQPYAFTGREYDAETGLYYYRARYYDPQLGRFISKDPIGFAGGINIFAYVGDNSVNWVDPYGLEPQGERGATGGSSGQNTKNKYKHCRNHPTDPNKIICKDHQTGQWKEKPKPCDWPEEKEKRGRSKKEGMPDSDPVSDTPPQLLTPQQYSAWVTTISLMGAAAWVIFGY